MLRAAKLYLKYLWNSYKVYVFVAGASFVGGAIIALILS